ncbi:Serine/threonine-protein kinase ATR [Frankliniella fusca]|uniref:Serine/threonine-protein kinase ATR n=1 Tax=Frankliniella fusca TaxID=407009 RepID=A0AAE1HK75_9NEOP|nr:Serine/threonine-protein kinase ATR [Frankliniella fusca]
MDLSEAWATLKAAVGAFYQEGMKKKGAQEIIGIINNSIQYKKNWYVPLPGASQEQVEQHTVFCTWMLGRLFCVLGRDSLSDYHASYIQTQIAILNACSENQFMVRFFCLEYLSCLTDLLAMQSSEALSDGQLLKRFTPQPLKALESLNLTPKYILVQSAAHASALAKYLVQLIEAIIPNIALKYNNLLEKCWLTLCQLTQVATPHLKIIVLNTFSKIISYSGFHSRIALLELCNTLKTVTKFVSINLLDKTESKVVQQLLSSVGYLVDVLISTNCCGDDTHRINDLLIVLHSVIVLWDVDDISRTGFETACKNVTLLLDECSLPSVTPEHFCFLISKFETQSCFVSILEKYVYFDLVNLIKLSKSENTQDWFQLNAVSSLPSWSFLHSQLCDEISRMVTDFPSESSKQVFREICDLVGKVKTMAQCALGVERLRATDSDIGKLRVSITFFENKVGGIVSFLSSLVQKLVHFKKHGCVVWHFDETIKSIILSLRYLFMLPEVVSSQLDVSEQAISIAMIPWAELENKTEFQSDFSEVSTLFPEVSCDNMKIISLHTLSSINRVEAHILKASVFAEIVKAPHSPKNEKIIVEAVKALPALLLDRSQEQSEYMYSVLLPALESTNEMILTAVSRVFPSVVCVLSGDIALASFFGNDGTLQRGFACLICEKDFLGSSVGACNVLQKFQEVLNKFITLLTSPIVAIRRNIAASLGSLVLHLPSLYQPETVKILLRYAEDDDHQVRLAFSRMVKFLIFSREWIEGKGAESEHLREEHIPLTQVDRVELNQSRPRLNQVLKLLYKSLITSLNEKGSSASELQKTILATIVDIGCVPLDCVLLPVLKIILIGVCHPHFMQPSIGQVYFKRIACAHNTSVGNLYRRFQSDLCQIMVSSIGENYTSGQLCKAGNKVVYSFGFESIGAWLRLSLKFVLPTLMMLAVKFDDQGFLQEMLELFPCPAADLIKENFQFIYPYVFLNETDEVVESCVKVMERMAGTNAQRLIVSSLNTAHAEFLLHYHCKKERVEEGICQLIHVLENKSSTSSRSKTPLQQADIAKHLEQRFLGVLVHFDSLLESSNSEESGKIKALQSLPQIIRLMGPKYITPVRLKVLSTLRTALRLTHCDFPHYSCGAWEAFIHSVDIYKIGPLLGTIAASLLPLLEQFPDEIASMLEWLVVEHEHELSNHIPDLFFLPDTPILHNVFRIVNHHVLKMRRNLNDSENLADYLQQPLRFITHDNVDMRRHGLEYLLSLLKEKQVQFTKSLLQEDIVHEDVSKLLALLIEGCRDTDHNIQILCVENLGMLGALDPSHLPHKKPERGMPQISSVDEDLFAVQALTALSKGYQAARNTRNLDSFAVAIQELLRSYNISSQPSHSKKNLWNSFPTNIQQVMAPLEKSSYYMTTLDSDFVWPHPLFGTRYASSLTNWAHTWACRIVKFINDIKAKTMFTVCIPSLKTDINCVLFFLPFILLYAVNSGHEDQHKMIVEEMNFVIQHRIIEEEEESSIRIEKLQLRTDDSVVLPPTLDSDRATHALCAKTVFNLLNFLEKWVGSSKQKVERGKKDSAPIQFENAEKFLAQFSKLDLAYGNYGVKEYARALMYLEDYLMDKKDIKDQELLCFLQRIYAQLNEPDGIKGVLAIQCSQPKLLENVVYQEVTGQYQEALSCYELLAMQHSNDDLGFSVQKGMIRCCLGMDQPNAALQIAQGATSQRQECRSAFLEAQAECFWRLNSFDSLENVLKDRLLENSTDWGVSIGRCLIDIRQGNESSFRQHLSSTRCFLSKALSTTSLEAGSYLQGYPYVIKLHMLQELEEAGKVIAKIQSTDSSEKSCLEAVQNLVSIWKDRLELVQAVSSVQEPLLRLRRNVLQLASTFVKESQFDLHALLHQELASSWLKSAEVARIAEHHQQAYIYLLNAEKYKPKRHFIEVAKLLWFKNEQDHALATLRRGLDEHFPNRKQFKTFAPGDMVEERKICAEAKLLIAKYNDESLNVDFDGNVSNYKEAVDCYQQWEHSHAELAQYYERMLDTKDQRDVSLVSSIQLWAVISYTKSLRFGCSLIHQSMSRMLTLWLDYGKSYHIAKASKASKWELNLRKDTLDEMNNFIRKHVDILPSYMFMTGFSQLVSRLCHPVADVTRVIQAIIVKLVLCYPQQTMWILVAMHRSTYALRQVRCRGVLEDPQIKRVPGMLELTTNFVKLAQQLTELCQKPVAKGIDTTNVSTLAKNLPKLLGQPSFSKIMVPLQTSRTLTLPQQEQNSLTSHLPFPLKVPHIVGIREKVVILPSLQRPRRITLIGSDGKDYDMMCKDKDDLRLDARVMEFSSIINKYLQKNPASSSRHLHIRTYSVIPLNENSGLIEWVPNLIGLRPIISQLYKEMGCGIANRDIKKHIVDKGCELQEKRDVFLNKLLPLHPPVFQHWFRNNFTDSRSWFEARKSYVHTTAVMSMVGYILGLGDRHGENILLDTTCGDAVHVDFNCLFNKGELFDWPERVPFRLTHNMVSAMGPTGVEGPFRVACEITLCLLRSVRETLLSVLQPFVYDPKAEVNNKAQEELTNDMAVENVKNITQRLSGRIKMGQNKNSLQLSVEGQTQFLIQEATSVDNLCQMYIGWMAYV